MSVHDEKVGMKDGSVFAKTCWAIGSFLLKDEGGKSVSFNNLKDYFQGKFCNTRKSSFHNFLPFYNLRNELSSFSKFPSQHLETLRSFENWVYNEQHLWSESRKEFSSGSSKNCLKKWVSEWVTEDCLRREEKWIPVVTEKLLLLTRTKLCGCHFSTLVSIFLH